jgi:hypothetical protein
MADTTSSTPILTWSAHEFEKKSRHPDWHWYVGLVFGIAAVLAFFYGNLFFGIFLVIAGAVVIIYAFRDPKLLVVAIGEKGITINNELLPYERITQFWLDETGKPDKLLLRVNGYFVPTITLPLEGVTADVVRAALVGKAKEEAVQESNSVKLFDRIGF